MNGTCPFHVLYCATKAGVLSSPISDLAFAQCVNNNYIAIHPHRGSYYGFLFIAYILNMAEIARGLFSNDIV